MSVICLEKGVISLPKNVKVLSLGKESERNHFKYLWRFYKYIWQERKNYDSVFVHMNQIYVILGGLYWRMVGKRISLWYTHKSVTISLRIAEKIAHIIFSASQKSFRLKSKKVIVGGHGIDTELFKPNKNIEKEDIILTVGRISKTKQLINIIDLLDVLPGFKLQVIGSPVSSVDENYYKQVIEKINTHNLTDRVDFVGDVQQKDLPNYYAKAKIFINLSKTGSLDKVVLEALSMNLRVLTSNEAFKEFNGIYIEDNNLLSVVRDEIRLNEYNSCSHEFIRDNHGLNNLIKKIIYNINETSK